MNEMKELINMAIQMELLNTKNSFAFVRTVIETVGFKYVKVNYMENTAIIFYVYNDLALNKMLERSVILNSDDDGLVTGVTYF